MFTFFIIFVQLSLGEIITTPSMVSISIDMPKIELRDEFREGSFYTDLSIPGAGIGLEVGKPKIPVIRKTVEIPEDADVKIEVKVEDRSMVLKYPIIPLQPPVPKIPGAQVEFTIDREFYKIDKFYPEEWASIVRVGYIRGHRVCFIEIYPVRYNPRNNVIHYAESVDITIKLTGSNMTKTEAVLHRYYSFPFGGMARKIIENYNVFKLKEPPQLPIGYLIICANDYYSNMEPFVEWKNKKGFYTTITKTSDIPGGATVTNITNYIKNAYDTWDIPPTFVLLVGDVDKIPAHTGSETGSVTDLYYSTTAGTDFIPDLYIGRFPVATVAQTNVLVEKILDYEKNLWSQRVDWLNKAYFMASDDGYHHQEVELCCNVCIQIARANGMVCDSLYAYYGTGTPISTAINNGRVVAVYTGHGDEYGWMGPSFSQSNVNALSNLDKYPFVASHACLTGTFSVSECFGETWVRSQDKGAIAFFGASTYTYWIDDDTLQIGWFRSMFGASPTNFIGGFTQLGLYAEYLCGGVNSTPRYYYEAYHVFGDPSMDLYTLLPTPISVSYPPVIPVGDFTMDVTVSANSSPIKDALVCGIADTQIVAYTNSSGIATLNIHTNKPCTLWITVTGHNLQPYEGYTLVVVPATVIINPDTIQVNTATNVSITVRDTLDLG
ncbi:MAG: C25 family cysteine peptidase, partial [bacterium]|nr:C25 family cysteine peptidase [bacterium]